MVQWATGNVGRHAVAAIHDHPDPELVGGLDEPIVDETLLLRIGGDDTARHDISGGMLAIMEHPDQLAALAADAGLREALARLPDLELDTDEPLPYRPSNFVSGLEAMPVRFAPTPVPA